MKFNVIMMDFECSKEDVVVMSSTTQHSLLATKDGILVFHFEMFTSYQLLKFIEIEMSNLT